LTRKHRVTWRFSLASPQPSQLDQRSPQPALELPERASRCADLVGVCNTPKLPALVDGKY